MRKIILDYFKLQKFNFIIVAIFGVLCALSEFLVVYITYLLISIQTYEEEVINIFQLDFGISSYIFLFAIGIIFVNAFLNIYFNLTALRLSHLAEPYFNRRLISHFYQLSRDNKSIIGTHNLKVSINKRFELVVSNIIYPLAMIGKVALQIIAVTLSIIYIAGLPFVLVIIFIFAIYVLLIYAQKLKLRHESSILDRSVSGVMYLSEDLSDCKNYIEASKNYSFISNLIERHSKAKAEALVLFRFAALTPRFILETLILTLVFGALLFVYINTELTLLDLLPKLASMAIGGLKLVSALQVGYQNYVNYQSSVAQIKELDEVFKYPTKPISDTSKDFKLINLNGTFNVGKSQTFRSIVVSDVTLRKGRMYSVIGDSGVGKSSFLKLFSQYTQFNGNIKINGVERTLDSISHAVELVEAKERLNRVELARALGSKGSLSSDLTALSGIVDRWKLGSVIDKLRAADGDYKLYEELSAGQLQRLILLRSIILGKEILLLDESTNALDTQMEKIVLTDLKKYSTDKLVLVVTHRTDNCDLFDEFISFENDQVLQKKL